MSERWSQTPPLPQEVWGEEEEGWRPVISDREEARSRTNLPLKFRPAPCALDEVQVIVPSLASSLARLYPALRCRSDNNWVLRLKLISSRFLKGTLQLAALTL